MKINVGNRKFAARKLQKRAKQVAKREQKGIKFPSFPPR